MKIEEPKAHDDDRVDKQASRRLFHDLEEEVPEDQKEDEPIKEVRDIELLKALEKKINDNIPNARSATFVKPTLLKFGKA